MNLCRKIYCRTIMGVLYMAKPFLPYHAPKTLKEIGEIPPLLKKHAKASVLLVTDAGLRSLGITSALEEQLKAEGIACTVYDKTKANPTVDNVEEALASYKVNKCEALIAFGGGSAIDCAKGIGARIARPNKTVNQMGGTFRVMRKIPLLIAIPTTAGTGSEATLTAVITDAQKGHKYTVNDFHLIPPYAVLDPKVTFSLPPHLTATTGMDALTHAVEAYIGHSTSRTTRAQSLQAIKLIFENIEKAYKDGSDYTARANMLQASYLAGMAFSMSYVGYVHSIAHSLGGAYNVPHGLANSVLLPVVLEAYDKAVHKKLYQLAVFCGIADAGDAHEAAANKFIEKIRELNKNMNIPAALSGIRKEDIPRMAKYADREANPLYPVPKLMDAKELERIYERIADWRQTE